MFKDLDKTYIIAEIGGNFKTYEEAVKLIDAAKDSGANCVKLQTYRAETIVLKSAYFDMENTGRISQYDYFKQYEISDELHKKIVTYINSVGIDWFSTPSHETDLDMLLKLGMKAIKIGADDATNLPLLEYCAKTKLPIVLSTGMCTLDEVKESVETITKCGNNDVVILHTVSGYPTHPYEVNLNVLHTYKKEFKDFYIGFSDHTLTPMACIAAASIGVNVLERHFTLDKNGDSPDCMISATPDEFKYIVDSVREIEKMKGSFEKKPFGSEIQNRINNRKSIVSLKEIKKGEVLTKENTGIRRPGNGIEPKNYNKIIGKIATKDIKAESILDWSNFS